MRDRKTGLDRRSFLKRTGMTAAGLSVGSLLPSPFLQNTLAADGPHSNKRLLFLWLRGANDGLNTLIPHGDSDYNTTNRPTLFIPQEMAIDLNGFASLHPSLTELMEIYNAGDLAAIHRVGYPDATRSHFDAQRIWENGDPSQPVLAEGWLYRYLLTDADARSGKFPVIGSPNAGQMVTGDQDTFKIDIANPDSFSYSYFAGQPNQDKLRAGWRAQYEQHSRVGLFRRALSSTELKLQDFIDEYASWDQANWNPTHPGTGEFLFPVSDETNPVDPDGPNGLKFNTQFYSFFKNLKVAALSLLESQNGSLNGTRIAGAQLGSWDTHEDQNSGGTTGAEGYHAERLGAVGYGLRSLWLVLSAQAVEPRGYGSIWQDTVITTLSEFGRTTLENGSHGTDHGNATCLFVAGGGINGGVHNCDPVTFPPGVMFGDEMRDLSHRTDYRALFWEILRDHMGADPATADLVFPGYSTMGLVEPGLISI